MKYRTIALAAHQAAGSTTLARCWRFERRDGTVVAVTTCARDLLFNGELYKSAQGANPTAIEQQADGAVANSEITAALSLDFATEEQIEAGIWDGTRVTIFEVNYRDLSMGRMLLPGHTLGEFSVTRGSFRAEVRGLTEALQKTTGDVYQPLCRWNLGDANCRFPIETLRVHGTLTAVGDRRTLADSTLLQPSDYFGAGVFRVEEGTYVGAEVEIYEFEAGGIHLVLPLAFNPWVGMAYSVIPGCRKRHERGSRNPSGLSDCATKFNNLPNFGGFPPSHFPGNNRILGLGSMTSTNFTPGSP